MIVIDPPNDPAIRLIGAVRGLVADAGPTRDQVAAFRPEAIALGTSPGELEGLTAHFLSPGAEPVVPLGPTELAEARALARYGEVELPHPTFVGLAEYGASAAIPVHALDADEEVQAEMFVAHIGYFELVRRTIRERRAGRRPPSAPDADRFALTWDRTIHPGTGSDRYAQARDLALLGGLKDLRATHRRVALVVDRERVPRLAVALALATGT